MGHIDWLEALRLRPWFRRPRVQCRRTRTSQLAPQAEVAEVRLALGSITNLTALAAGAFAFDSVLEAHAGLASLETGAELTSVGPSESSPWLTDWPSDEDADQASGLTPTVSNHSAAAQADVTTPGDRLTGAFFADLARDTSPTPLADSLSSSLSAPLQTVFFDPDQGGASHEPPFVAGAERSDPALPKLPRSTGGGGSSGGGGGGGGGGAAPSTTTDGFQSGAAGASAGGGFALSPASSASSTTSATAESIELPVPAAPRTVTVTSPDAIPTVSWTASDGAASYDLKIYSVAQDRFAVEAPGLITTEHTLSGPLDGPDTYVAYIRGVNIVGEAGYWRSKEFPVTTQQSGSGTVGTLDMHGNTPPVAEDDFYSTVINTTLTVPSPRWPDALLANDWDPDGDPLEALCPGTTEMGGTLTDANGQSGCNADGSFQYAPPANFEGGDWFWYTAWDGQAGTDAIASIEVVFPKADIDIDSNNIHGIDPDNSSLGTDDPIEENAPGQYIPVNDNDDNENLEWDLNDSALTDANGVPLDDGELREVQLDIDESRYDWLADRPDFVGFAVIVTASSELRLWTTQDKTGPLGNLAEWTKQADGTWCGPVDCGAFPGLIYVEGYEPSAAEGGAELMMELWNNEPTAELIHTDLALATAIKVDLDIDSDNTNGLQGPDRTDAEDKIEDARTRAGKLLPANWNDDDSDGVVDYADFSNVAEKFTPLVLEAPVPIDLAKADFNLAYSASDPALAPDCGQLGAGHLRIWRVDGDVTRNPAGVKAGGDYFAPDVYTAGELGLSGTRTVTLYVEGICTSANLGEHRIGITVAPDRYLADEMGNVVFVHHDAHRAIVFSVQILNATKASTDKLKVAKWQNAFEGDPPALKAEFIDLDPDRFHVRVKNVAANTDAATKQKVTIKLSTDSPGTDYDDDPTGIELTETGVDTGVFESKSLMLMGDDVDDDHGANGVGADDLLNDRSHKIALGGIVKVEYEPAAGMKDSDTAKVQKVKSVTAKVVILRNKPESEGGTPVVSTAHVNSQWTIVKERYAQVGIDIVWSITTIDPPVGVDLSNGLLVRPSPDSHLLAAEAKSLIEGGGTKGNIDDLHAFYVRDVFVGASELVGTSVPDYWFDESEEDYLNNLFISDQTTFPFVEAHELAHLLTDGGHEPEKTNLLYTFLGEANTVTAAKRLDTVQEGKSQSNRLAK